MCLTAGGEPNRLQVTYCNWYGEEGDDEQVLVEVDEPVIIDVEVFHEEVGLRPKANM